MARLARDPCPSTCPGRGGTRAGDPFPLDHTQASGFREMAMAFDNVFRFLTNLERMEFDTSRRRFLELAGAGTALSVAGCSALQGQGTDATPAETTEGTDEGTNEGTDGGTNGGTDEGSNTGTDEGPDRVTVILQPDQEKLTQRQDEIRSELQAGNISRQEAQQQAADVQSELISKAAGAFRDRTSSNENLAVEGAVDQFGVLLVSGSASGLVDALVFPEVNALMPVSSFLQAKSQAAQGTPTPTPSE